MSTSKVVRSEKPSNYGHYIKTLRLFRNVIGDIEELKTEEREELEQGLDSKEGESIFSQNLDNEEDEGNEGEFRSLFKSQGQIAALMNERQVILIKNGRRYNWLDSQKVFEPK